MRFSAAIIYLVCLCGCQPPPPQHRAVEIDPMQPVWLRLAWEQFARDAYVTPLLSLVQPAANIDLGNGPEMVRADYLQSVGTLLTITGAVQYDDERGVRMQATYFIRWYFAGMTNVDYTPWTLRAAGIVDKKPVPPPETQPDAKPT